MKDLALYAALLLLDPRSPGLCPSTRPTCPASAPLSIFPSVSTFRCFNVRKFPVEDPKLLSRILSCRLPCTWRAGGCRQTASSPSSRLKFLRLGLLATTALNKAHARVLPCTCRVCRPGLIKRMHPKAHQTMSTRPHGQILSGCSCLVFLRRCIGENAISLHTPPRHFQGSNSTSYIQPWVEHSSKRSWH